MAAGVIAMIPPECPRRCGCLVFLVSRNHHEVNPGWRDRIAKILPGRSDEIARFRDVEFSTGDVQY